MPSSLRSRRQRSKFAAFPLCTPLRLAISADESPPCNGLGGEIFKRGRLCKKPPLKLTSFGYFLFSVVLRAANLNNLIACGNHPLEIRNGPAGGTSAHGTGSPHIKRTPTPFGVGFLHCNVTGHRFSPMKQISPFEFVFGPFFGQKGQSPQSATRQ